MFYDFTSSSAPAFFDEDQVVFTYAECVQSLIPLEEALAYPEKSLIFLFLDQSIESVFAYLAALRVGHAAYLASWEAGLSKSHDLIQKYRPRFLWVPEAQQAPEGYEVLATDVGTLFVRRAEGASAIHPNLAVLLSSSGSTGSPKLIRLSKTNLQSNALSIAEYMRLTGRDRAISTLPFFYSYGMSVLNSHLAARGGLICTKATILQKEFWLAFKANEATFLAGVPFTFEMFERLRFEHMDLLSLRLLVQAGGKLAPGKIQKFYEIAKAKNFEFLVMYGQTEASPRISYVPFNRLKDKIGSIGIPIPGGACRLKAVPGGNPNEGELVYEGANVMMGYATAPVDLAKDDEMHGRLETGDLACRDSDGFYYLVGRLKRFIKIAGLRISLEEVQAFLSDALLPPVAVLGEDELLKVRLETQDETIITDVVELLSRHLNIHPIKIEVKAIAQIPRSASGKIQYELMEAK